MIWIFKAGGGACGPGLHKATFRKSFTRENAEIPIHSYWGLCLTHVAPQGFRQSDLPFLIQKVYPSQVSRCLCADWWWVQMTTAVSSFDPLLD